VRDLGRTAGYEISAPPRPLLGQERYLFGHPVPQVLNRRRLAGPPDPGKAAPLGFALVRLHPHRDVGQESALPAARTDPLDDKQRAVRRYLDRALTIAVMPGWRAVADWLTGPAAD